MADGREKWMSSSRREKEFALPSSFCSFWAPKRLGHARPHWGGQISLLSLLSQSLTSCRNTHMGTPRNNVLPASCLGIP